MAWARRHYEWDDLSDEELQARLEQRGVLPTAAGALVRDRDEPYAAHLIQEALAR